ncbi:MAG TPA: hypothetical protein VFZ65_23830 [Planctomycetota bacterium]|nr:hypothetical protein [Planctomycetota bacterium]
MLRTRFAAFCLSVASMALVSEAAGQVPEGAAVVGTYNDGVGVPGLFFVTLPAGQVTPVTGLPPELQFTNGANQSGAWSLSRRARDGAVIVGTTDFTGANASDVYLFVLHLIGNAVDPTRTQQILLGGGTGLKVAWHVALPADRLLVVAANLQQPLATGPMAGHFLAIVDLSPSLPAPTVTPLPYPNPPVPAGYLGGIALDPTAAFGYFTISDHYHSAPANASLFRYELANGQVCPVATWPGESAFGVACDDDGTVYVSSSDATTGAHRIHAVRNAGCAGATVTPTTSSQTFPCWGMALDRADGLFVAMSGTSNNPMFTGPQNSVSLIDPASGFLLTTVPPPAAGWGKLGQQAVVVNNAIESYGGATDGQSHYWFDNFPNPGGLPLVGANGFFLTMAADPSPALFSLLLLSLGSGSTAALGVEILVDPATVVPLSVPAGISVPVALPIPPDPALVDFAFFAQGLHLEANGGFAGSRGWMLTVQ